MNQLVRRTGRGKFTSLVNRTVKGNILAKARAQPFKTSSRATGIALNGYDCADPNDVTKVLDYVDEFVSEASDTCKTWRGAEEEFFKALNSNNIITIQKNTNNIENVISNNDVRLGTESKNDSDRRGHIYGIHYFGPLVDEPNTILEYPVGKDVVILSLANTQKIEPDFTTDGVEFENDDNPEAFLSGKSSGNFQAKIDDDCIFTIKRVMNVETWDFDYLRDLDRSTVNKKMDDGTHILWYIVYGIKRKKVLKK